MGYSKSYICKLMQANLWHHRLFHFHLPFWIQTVWRGREKIQKFEYLENERNFYDEIKNIFHSFWRSIIWRKNKNLIRNSGQKLLLKLSPNLGNKIPLQTTYFKLGIFVPFLIWNFAQKVLLTLITYKSVANRPIDFKTAGIYTSAFYVPIHKNKKC